MDRFFNVGAVQALLADAMEQILETVSTYGPRLLAGIALLVLGWVVARLASALVSSLLRRVGFDALSAQTRVTQALRRAGVTRAPSRIVQRVLFWGVWLVFALASLDALGLSDLPQTLGRVAEYLPDLLGAAFILGVGVLTSRFAKNLLSSAALVGGLKHGERLGVITQRLTLALFSIVAAQQLGFEADLIVAVVALTLGTFAIAFAVAFSMGAGPVIRHILAGHFLRQSLPVGGSITISGKRGLVERVGTVDTLLRTGDELWTVPNGRLLEEVLIR